MGASVYKPRKAKDHGHHQGLGERLGTGFPLSPQKESAMPTP